MFTAPGLAHLTFELKPLSVFSCSLVSNASERVEIAPFLALSAASPVFLLFLSQTAAQTVCQLSESLALQSCSVLFVLRESLLANFFNLYSSHASVHACSGYYFCYFSLLAQRELKCCLELSSMCGGISFHRSLAPLFAISAGLAPMCSALPLLAISSICRSACYTLTCTDLTF